MVMSPAAGRKVVVGPSGRARIGRIALRQGRKWSGDLRQGRKWLVGPTAGTDEFGGPYGRTGSGREALRQGHDWLGGPAAGLELVGGPAEWTKVVGGPPAGPELVGKPFGSCGSGRGALRQERNWLGALWQGQKRSGGPPAWPQVAEGSLVRSEVVGRASGRAVIGR